MSTKASLSWPGEPAAKQDFLVVAADFGDKGQLQVADLQGAGDAVQQPDSSSGTQPASRAYQSENNHPAQLGGALDGKAELFAALADAPGQQHGPIGALGGRDGRVLRGGHRIIAHILIISRTAPPSRGNSVNYLSEHILIEPAIQSYKAGNYQRMQSAVCLQWWEEAHGIGL